MKLHIAEKNNWLHPGSTLHGYLSKILAKSCNDLGKILAKIVTRHCQELQDAIFPRKLLQRSLKLPRTAKMKKLLRTAWYREKVESENH